MAIFAAPSPWKHALARAGSRVLPRHGRWIEPRQNRLSAVFRIWYLRQPSYDRRERVDGLTSGSTAANEVSDPAFSGQLYLKSLVS